MAYFKTGGGGSMSETVLWTNASPTSNFDTQTITLSDSIANYDYVKIEYRLSTSNATTMTFLVETAEFQKMTGEAGTPLLAMGAYISSTHYVRRFHCPSNTSVYVRVAGRYGNTGSYTGICIPTNIYGVK